MIAIWPTEIKIAILQSILERQSAGRIINDDRQI